MSPALINTYDTTAHVLFGIIIHIKDGTNRSTDDFSLKIKLVFVILEIHFFKKDSVRFLGCFKNYFRR